VKPAARSPSKRGKRGFPGGGYAGGGGPTFGRRGLAPDPKTLHAIATLTGGKFYRARSAGAVQDTYASLSSKLGRKRGNTEVTDLFLAAAAGLFYRHGIRAVGVDAIADAAGTNNRNQGRSKYGAKREKKAS